MGGRGGGGVVGKYISRIFSKFVWLLQLVRNFFFGTENIITNKQKNRSSAEQA